MGNDDKHFWGSSEQRNDFSDQGNLSLSHVSEQVVLLMATRDKIEKNIKGSWEHVPPPPPPPIPGEAH